MLRARCFAGEFVELEGGTGGSGKLCFWMAGVVDGIDGVWLEPGWGWLGQEAFFVSNTPVFNIYSKHDFGI